ncbi:hypothetical protein L596_012939 [Steinernema carpocapsae]|uniref:Uncharacterized protein n=1 Tax=Steinernema carpocapsae TaxID=34508 RepID=A0A4U5NZC7_STECR|nr:hypothetical protein L596_012939 [Steinernema carpocapsae]
MADEETGLFATRLARRPMSPIAYISGTQTKVAADKHSRSSRDVSALEAVIMRTARLIRSQKMQNGAERWQLGVVRDYR